MNTGDSLSVSIHLKTVQRYVYLHLSRDASIWEVGLMGRIDLTTSALCRGSEGMGSEGGERGEGGEGRGVKSIIIQLSLSSNKKQGIYA